jgi:hypothetical protein
MPTIRTTIATIEYAPVLEYYNGHKNDNEPNLERLYRAEGGFQIQIPDKQHQRGDPNEKIRQLRWKQRSLVPHNGFCIFE